MDDMAVEVRQRLRIPPLGSASVRHRADQDGWLVLRRGARFIGLVRRYPAPAGRMLLARRLREKLAANTRLGLHVSHSWDAMDAAGHHIDDPALALAVAMREAETNITLSTRYACSYHRGGLDNVWAI